MGIFKNIPKIYKGLIYLFLAVDWWLFGKLTLFKPVPNGAIRTDITGLEIPLLIYSAVILALGLLGIVYTIQGIKEIIEKK
ncbi:hypothetical protein JXB28_01260 [Candidatus Woesearchaeota archaeon]|nr:hypothetical protein [Candidatus Woesearchaeota archaeon]